jgi:S1-C subfamily serine protease
MHQQENQVVYIETGHYDGAGVLINDHEVLTALHTIKDGKKAPIKVFTFSNDFYSAQLVWSSDADDLAVLDIEPYSLIHFGYAPLTPAVISCRAPIIGEDVTLLGHPADNRWSFSWGRVSSERLDPKGLVPMMLPTLPGDSGGPVYDTQGKVIGIMDAAYENQASYSFMVPITSFCRDVPRSIYG